MLSDGGTDFALSRENTRDTRPAQQTGRVNTEPDKRLSLRPAQASPCGSGGVTSYDPLKLEWVVRGSVHHDRGRGV
jgi:hypothetical protein